ncbi:MAG: hypothetical protein AB3N14_16530 [Flavobacteriaceae bacterium]
MLKQNETSELSSYKIVIEGEAEDLNRISTFLDNNYIRHSVIDKEGDSDTLEEFEGYIDWPII